MLNLKLDVPKKKEKELVKFFKQTKYIIMLSASGKAKTLTFPPKTKRRK